MAAINKGSLVLVTGVNGYIASHIADQLLERNYAVRGTVRSADKGDWMKQAFAQRHPNARFEVVVVADMAAPGAFDHAMDGVAGVAHVASNTSFTANPNAMIPDTLSSLRHVMETAAAHKSVTRFVYTSSSTAASLPRPGEKFSIGPDTWNDASVEAAWKPPPYEGREWDVYAASKTETERAAWKFVKDNRPGFVLNAVLPSFNTGPILHAKQPASTAGWVHGLFKDPQNAQQAAILRSLPPQYSIDVRDDALLHVAALTEEDVQNERLFGYSHPVNFNSWLAAFRVLAPEKQWPEDDPEQSHDVSVVATKRSEELLQRFGSHGWRSLEASIKDTVQEPPTYTS